VKTALETNILVHAEGMNGAERAEQARAILSHSPELEFVISVQALADLFTVLTRKTKWASPQARAAILSWQGAYTTIDTTMPVLHEAMDIATPHQFALWDFVMIAAAAQSGCRFLLSEDIHPGFTWRSVEIRNPFT
jgi:predicted nucleic acid-binding protein